MKRLCALLLCGILLIPQLSAPAAAFWPTRADEAVAWGEEMSISQEFLDQPGAVVTRGMAAQLLYEVVE